MYSNYICELCLRALQLANALRIQLLENEQRLYDLIEQPESPIQAFDPDFISRNYENQYEHISEIPQPEPKLVIHEDEHVNQVKNENADEKTVIKEEMPSNKVLEDFTSNVSTVALKTSNSTVGKIKVNKELGKMPASTNFIRNSRSSRSSEKVLHRNPETNEFECNYCSFITESQNLIKSHLITSHKTQINTYKCKFCDSTYFKGSNLKRHILSKHMNHRFKCTIPSCSVQLQDRSSLRRHIISTHGKNMTQDQIQSMMKKSRKGTISWFD